MTPACSARSCVIVAFFMYPKMCEVTSKFFVCTIPGYDDDWVLPADVTLVCGSDIWCAADAHGMCSTCLVT